MTTRTVPAEPPSVSGPIEPAELDDDRNRWGTLPVLDVVIPVYNEQADLEPCVRRLDHYLRSEVPYPARITIADNASTDGTLFVARRLKAEFDNVEIVHLEMKGRGRALRAAWLASPAKVVAYMDVDLSTGLDALMPLVAPLISGHSDLAIGSRLSAGSSVARRPKREVISRCYNVLLRTAFATRVHDAQCGFKAVRADVARALLPVVEDDEWFFDTELLLVAEHNGLRIHEVPVDWIDDADSRVHIVGTAVGDLKGAARVARRFMRGDGSVDLGGLARPHLTDDFGRRVVSFAAVGI